MAGREYALNGNGFKTRAASSSSVPRWPGFAPLKRYGKRGFAGYLTIIGDEPDEPYDRPPLSKQVLKGWVAADHTKLPRMRAGGCRVAARRGRDRFGSGEPVRAAGRWQ